LWNKYKTLSEDRLAALSFKRDGCKVDSKRVGNASALPILFLLFSKGAYGNIRDKQRSLRGQSRALTVWSTGSFGQRSDKVSYGS